jgi:C1A family cysteine protease
MINIFILFYSCIIVALFYFVTTELYSLRLGGESWVFFAAMASMILMLSIYHLVSVKMAKRKKITYGVVVFILVVIQIILGIRTRPFKAEHRKYGLIPNREDDDTRVIEENDNYSLMNEFNDLEYLPSVNDQKSCGGCWAVAAATVLSARYSRKQQITQNNIESTCVSTTRGWHFSPQFILDKDTIVGTKCNSSSYGKCNGNAAIAGFKLAASFGIPSESCIPFFAGQDTCKLNCNSPTSLICNGKINCVHDQSYEWTKCTNDKTEFFKKQATDVHIIKGVGAMKNQLINHGPIACSINTYTLKNNSHSAWTLSGISSIFGLYEHITSAGFVSRPIMDKQEYRKDYSEGGHLITLYGFGTSTEGVPYWMIRNSWGDGWGNNGNSKIERGVDAWNIESNCAAAYV